MELILAIVVASAVIFFGALISLGNERQRKAIDELREQMTLWAVQDLKIKRESLLGDVRVDNPLSWLNRITTKISGTDLNLQIIEAFDNPRALICSTSDGCKVVFSPLSPLEVQRFIKVKRNRLLNQANHNPLIDLPQKKEVYEFSIFNCGVMFDIELSLAWKGLTNQTIEEMSRMWMYKIVQLK